MKSNLRCVAAAGLCSFFIASASGALDAHAAGPSLYVDLSTTQMLSQRYAVTYYDGNNWISLPAGGGNVVLNPRFSEESGSTSAPYGIYKYGIELKDKNSTNSTFYIFLSTNKDLCIVNQTTSTDYFSNQTLGYVYDVTTQYTNLVTSDVQNANVSVAYRVCSKPNVISVRLFDPITSGIPIGIGAHVDNQSTRISETYIVLNTEGILYPQ